MERYFTYTCFLKRGLKGSDYEPFLLEISETSDRRTDITIPSGMLKMSASSSLREVNALYRLG